MHRGRCDKDEQGDLDAVDIKTLLCASDYNVIDVMKIDIEGAESELFSRNYDGWIDRVNTFVIELHGDSHKRTFLQALSDSDFVFSTSGELTIAQRRNSYVG